MVLFRKLLILATLGLMLSGAFVAPAGATTVTVSARVTSLIGADGHGVLQALYVTVRGKQHKCAHPGAKRVGTTGSAFACSGVGAAYEFVDGTTADVLVEVGSWKHYCTASMSYGRFKRAGHTYGYIEMRCQA